MYFDYAILAFMIWGVGDAIFGASDNSADSDETQGTDTETDPDNTGDGGDLLDQTDADSTDDTDEGTLYVSGPTTITVETDGETATSTFEDVDFGIAPTVSGSDARDIITASDNTGFEMNIDAGAGDDFVTFGYGANVDGGEGADVMVLNVTQNALAADSEVGQIDMRDTDDTLSVTFEDETQEFVHTVRGQTITIEAGITTRVDWIDYYVSDTEALSTDNLTSDSTYNPEEATRVFRAVLGSGTDVDAPLNEAPAILVNRTVATATDVTD